MAGRSHYTDAKRAEVHALLQLHDGNIKRTAREADVPITTVRDWKNEWARAGVPAVIEVASTKEVQRFVAKASEMRDLALEQLGIAIPIAGADGKARDLAVIVGVLDDKIVRAQGKPTSISQTNAELPSAREVQALLAGYISGTLNASREREEVIEAVTVEELD